MKKRILSLVLAFVMVFSLAVPTFAAETAKPVADQVKLLEGLGLLTGEGGGLTPEYLAKEMTRIQAACALLKMVGKYDEAKVFAPTENFPDATGTWAEGNNIMGYLKANPSYGFSGDAGKFNPTGTITQQELFKVVLTQLAFLQDVDYKWEEVTTFGVAKGLVSVEGVYNTQALAQNVYSALTVPNKTTKATIADELAKDEAKKALLVAAGIIAGVEAELEAVSAEFLNLRQIKVIFNKELSGADKTAAKEITNYSVNGTSLIEFASSIMADAAATVKVSGKEAIITLQGSAIAATVTNAKTTNTVEFKDTKFEKLSSIDKDFPTIVGYKVNGPREIEIEFSEAVKVTGTAFKLNEGKISVTAPTDKYNNVLVIKTYADLKDGEYTLNVKADDVVFVKDGAGYPVLTQDYKFNVVKDTVAPTVAVDGVTVENNQIAVDLQFSKNITIGNIKAKLGHVEGTAGTITGADDYYTVTFPTGSAPGTQTIYFVNGATKAKDTWGNVFEDQTLAFDIVLDTEAPTVKSVVAKDDNKIVVTFSEVVVTTATGNGIPTTNNFVVRDAKNNTVALAPIEAANVDKEKVTLTLGTDLTFLGGTYTVEMKNLQDKSMYKNKLVTVKMTVDTKDKVAPYITSIATAGTNKYRVVFSETMDSSVAAKANWNTTTVTGTMEINSVTMSGDSKSITIDLKAKSADGVFAPATDKFVASVDSIKDLAGNKLVGKAVAGDVQVLSEVAGFTATIGVLSAVPKISPSKIQVIDRKTIKMTFKDSIMEDINADTFVVNTNNAVSGIGMEVVDNSDSVVTLTLTDKMKTTTESAIETLTAKAGATAKNQYGYELSTDANLGCTEIIDKAAPEMMSAKVGAFDGSVADNFLQVIELKFSEALYAGSVQDSDFTVDGQTIQKIAVAGDTVTITLKKVEYDLKDTDVLVTLVGSVQDEVQNATTENTELTARTEDRVNAITINNAAQTFTTTQVTTGVSIATPTATDCTFVVKTAGTAIDATGKILASGNVIYSMTHTPSGIVVEKTVVITVS